MREIRTLYTWLEIAEDATKEQIKRAYRQKAMDCHPDRGGDPTVFAKISEAHTVLMDDERRLKYDKRVRKVRLQVRLEAMRDDAYSKLKEMWEYEEQVYQNRRTSEQSDYFAEQERLEKEWQDSFSTLIQDYQKKESINSQNLESILRSTDDLLTSFAKSGKIRFGERRFSQSPIEMKVDPEVNLPGVARDVMLDFRDTIAKAERLVRIFNKLTRE
jgi:curved DNA-binding protein CbpA